MARIVLHIDYDCFYASCIENERPELKTVPLGIQQKNILATCNYPARARGVKKLQPVAEAKRVCPEIVLVNGEDLTKFRDVSKTMWMFVREFIWGNLTERLGFDEMVDFNLARFSTGGPHRPDTGFFQLSRTDASVGFPFEWATVPGHTYPAEALTPASFTTPLHQRLLLGAHLGSFLRAQILAQFNHTCSAGVATTKLAAKLAGAVHKPAQQTVLLPESVQVFLAAHEIGAVPGIGFKTADKIRAAVHRKTSGEGTTTTTNDASPPPTTIAAVRATLTPGILDGLAGGHGAGGRIWGWLHGSDDTRVTAAEIHPTQISLEDTFRPGRVTNIPTLQPILTELIVRLLQRMHTDLVVVEDDPRRGGGDGKWIVSPRTFRLSARFHGGQQTDARASKSAPFPGFALALGVHAVDRRAELAERLVREVALPLFRRLCPPRGAWELQLVNVAAVNMAGEGTGKGLDIRDMFAWESGRNGVVEGRGGGGGGGGGGLRNIGVKADDDDEIDEEVEDEDEDLGFKDVVHCERCGTRMPFFALDTHNLSH